MKTRKLVRRAFCLAAVSTVSLIPLMDAEAFGFDTSVRSSASGIQLVQYQSGTPSANPGQPNQAVTAELKRMFEESGQPMPSMNPKDLPNAQGQQANMVRPTQRPGGPPAAPSANVGQKMGQPNAGLQQAASKPKPKTQQPAKKNFLQKFMGRVSGQDKKASDAAVVPPVPPDFREPAPAPPAGQSVARTPAAANSMQPRGATPPVRSATANASQIGTQNRMNPDPRTQSGTPARTASSSQVRPPVNGQMSAPSSAVPVRPAVAGQGSGQVRIASQPTQPVPAVPAASRVVRTQPNAAPAQDLSGTPQYVQPGTAPGFMPPKAAKPVAAAKPAALPAVVNAQPKAVVPRTEDGFELPFVEEEIAGDASDSLDLDSLVQPVAPLVQEAVAADPGKVLPPVSVADEADAFVEETVQSVRDKAELNPLTGVRLDAADADLFDPDKNSALSSGAGVVNELKSIGANGIAGEGLPSAEDFESTLPAINLPSVEDLEESADAMIVTQPDLGLPDLDAEDAAEFQKQLQATPNNSRPAPAGQPVEAAEKKVTAVQSIDTEKLQQVAEQDRRLRQQRLIQSRADQTGFKGFCPVALRDRRELVDTKPEYSATFGLQSYTFSSEDAKSAFESDPSRYAPAAGGSDVVLLVNSGEEQPGMLDYALWYRDRLYLFRSRETMAMFNKDPLRFANQY